MRKERKARRGWLGQEVEEWGRGKEEGRQSRTDNLKKTDDEEKQKKM